jgi:hypothetical protein
MRSYSILTYSQTNFAFLKKTKNFELFIKLQRDDKVG